MNSLNENDPGYLLCPLHFLSLDLAKNEGRIMNTKNDSKAEDGQTHETSQISRRGFLAGSAVLGVAAASTMTQCTTSPPGEVHTESTHERGSRSESTTDAGQEQHSETHQVEPSKPEPLQEPNSSELSTQDASPELDPSDALQEPTAPDDALPEDAIERLPEVRVQPDPSNVPIQEALFPLHVQAGAMREESAIVWSFAADKKPKQLKVWQTGKQVGSALVVVDASVTPDSEGYIKEVVRGLQGGQWYYYAFFQGSQARSRIGKFKTAFAAGSMEPLTIGATCCTKDLYKPFKSLLLTAKEPIDLIVHLGDMSYNDKAKNLAEYRTLWRKTLTTSGYPELLTQAGMYITWDDHEVRNNFDPETMDAALRTAATQAFTETLPVEFGPKQPFWQRYSWGSTADIFVLDCRGERRPSTRKSKDPIYISKAQMKWLKQGLESSTAHFKILLNSVPITNMPAIWLTTGDRWEGYAEQRKELLQFITDKKLKNVWFLSGDFHTSFVSKLEKSGPWSHMREIACGPGGAFPNPLGVGLLKRTSYPSSQFDFGQSVSSMMTTLTFDPKRNDVHVKLVNARNGKVMYDKKITQS